ncbi:MAG: sugar transferase [Oscillospiraceae bacterium]|nr:sugar transferase [Oscillospiraceae bacterium]
MENIASPHYLFAKRFLDVIFSFFSIILLIPVFLLVATMIRFDSNGSIIFCQYRCGYKGKVFKMYKFRSMVANAPSLKRKLESKNEAKGQMFKIKNDPRVTRVGRFIRKSSIDELPQLINVLKGDMSFVGPRPPILTEVVRYDPWHNLRLSVKPGITGLWQTSKRNEVIFDDMVRLDLKYIRERNFWLDIKLILKTIPLLLGDKKAS